MVNLGFNIYNRIAQRIPGIRLKLTQADMNIEPSEFVRRTVITSLYMTLGIYIVLFLFFSKMGGSILLLLLSSPIAYIFMFMYFLKLPELKIMKKEKEINKEIVFAGRFLMIELESGVPIYDTFLNVSKSYKQIGKYFRETIDKVKMGTSMDQALAEATELTPSANLRKIFWQILNSMKTGADVTKSLNSALDQITREQQIEVQEYGKKLNPLAMFYMMIAVIIPSLGMTLLMALATFTGLKLSLISLLMVAGFVAFIQFMFLTMVKNSRPAVEM